jgi:hypothetical protein
MAIEEGEGVPELVTADDDDDGPVAVLDDDAGRAVLVSGTL